MDFLLSFLFWQWLWLMFLLKIGRCSEAHYYCSYCCQMFSALRHFHQRFLSMSDDCCCEMLQLQLGLQTLYKSWLDIPVDEKNAWTFPPLVDR
jgi:hypothetical protein